MDSYVLLRFCYDVRPISDHTEVSHNFQLSYTNRLSHAQGVCRDGEEPLDRFLLIFYHFCTGCFWDGLHDVLGVASRYDILPCTLKKISEENRNFESGDIS